MKRSCLDIDVDIDNTKTINYGKLFFGLDESIEILLDNSPPSPHLLTILLKTSKVFRRRVWNFLTNPDKCKQQWCIRLCLEIYRARRPGYVPGFNYYYNMYPIFIMVNNDDHSKSYYVGRVLINMNQGSKDDVLVSSYSANQHTKKPFLSWEVYRSISKSDTIEWYIVANALSIRTDSRILSDNLTRFHNNDCKTSPWDDLLFITL